jgi:hypothetical protein
MGRSGADGTRGWGACRRYRLDAAAIHASGAIAVTAWTAGRSGLPPPARSGKSVLLQPLLIHRTTAHGLQVLCIGVHTKSLGCCGSCSRSLAVKSASPSARRRTTRAVLHEALEHPTRLDELQACGPARVLELVHLLALGPVAVLEHDQPSGAVRQSVVRLGRYAGPVLQGADIRHAVAHRLASAAAGCHFGDVDDHGVG